MIGEDIEIDTGVEEQGGDNSSSGSTSTGSSGGSGGRRTNVFVEGVFGTTAHTPDTKCDVCGDRATRVLVYGGKVDVTFDISDGLPTCTDCVDGAKERYVREFHMDPEKFEERRFVD